MNRRLGNFFAHPAGFIASLLLLIVGLAYAQQGGQVSEVNAANVYAGATSPATATNAARPISVFQSGSFTGTVTGYATPPTGTVQYRISAGGVSLFLTTAITGMSNAATMTMTGLPAAVCPDIDAKQGIMIVTDNDALGMGGFSVAVESSSTCAITFSTTATFDASGFTTSGTKALQDTWHISYPLD